MTEPALNTEYDKSQDSKRAFKYCIHLLAKCDYSTHKLSQKLLSKKYTQAVVDICISKLLDLDYLREESYIRMRILGLAKKGYGVGYIIQKCHSEKLEVDEDLIYQHLEAEGLNEESIFLYQLEKKTRNLDFDTMPQEEIYKTKDKIKRNLFSRGFSFDLIKKHI